ncbi:TraB/GumN family protein [Flavobacterium agricola]|uniref:TraB/GumN family protein n=1 Tax=Flavobacterium agricola TaxID=2870839 RepID=A0ABY6M3K2_9FLAO|nr:TraB/GumN family protein [Flavobacterium agricola]UYW02487.1 TraB/GumN family protein [Flavobacterium agricola]
MGKNFKKKNKFLLSKVEESNLVLVENIGESYPIINVRENNLSTDFLNQNQLKLLENIISNKTTIKKLSLKEIMIKIDEVWAKKSCLNNRERKDSLSLDDFLIKSSQEKGIKVVGLEDLSITIEYINKYTYEKFDDDRLKEIIVAKLNNINQNIKHSNCKIEKKYRTKSYDYNFNKNVEHPILAERNINWMRKIPSFLNEYKKVFIAVGIGHLDYENGLLNLLKNEGYSITPIKI